MESVAGHWLLSLQASLEVRDLIASVDAKEGSAGFVVAGLCFPKEESLDF